MLASCSRHVLTNVQRVSAESARHSLKRVSRVAQESRRRASELAHKKLPEGAKVRTAILPPGRISLAACKLRLARARAVNAFRLCGEMKEKGIIPDLETYHLLLIALVKEAWTSEAFAVLEDMMAMGIQPNVTTYNTLMRINRLEDPLVSLHIIDMMKEQNVAPDSETFEILVDRYIAGHNIERCLEIYAQAQSNQLRLNTATVEKLIAFAADQNLPRLACQMAEHFEHRSVISLNVATWVKCLMASSEQLFADGVLQCWEKLVDGLGFHPDEGMCLEVLHTAGRHHLPKLAASAIGILRAENIPLQEYHFAPLLESLCGANLLSEAVASVDLMRESGVTPTLQTVDPIVQWIRTSTDGIDHMWSILDDLRAAQKPIDIMVVNALIKAAIDMGELQRAMGIFQAIEGLGITPNQTTFEELLGGCVVLRNRQLGDRLLEQMQELKIRPQARTYQRLIELCLTQDTYEDAFFYLEEMKGLAMKPPIEVYIAIVRKCVENKDERYMVAEEEMKELGYKIPYRDSFLFDEAEVKRPRTHLENEWLALLAKRREAEAVAAAQVETDELLRRIVPSESERLEDSQNTSQSSEPKMATAASS